MPIKFRCQHCDQFLGIAKSRAGANVDCPRCGRTLRVPGNATSNGQVKPDAPQQQHNALASALSELSALADERPEQDLNRPDRSPVESPFVAAEPVGPVDRPTAASVPRHQPEGVPTTTVPIDESDSPVSDSIEPPVEGSTFSHEQGLHELAALSADYRSGELSPALLDEMRSVSRQASQTIATVIGGICLLLLGIAGGWYLAKSGTPQNLPLLNFTTVRQAVAGSPNADQGTDRLRAAPADLSERIVTGTLLFENETGQRIPDAGSLMLLFPLEHPGTLILSGRSLMQGDSSADFRATAAALATLGGRVIRVSDDGSFATSLQPDTDFIAIAISQHMSRPESVSIPTGIGNALKTWFDSPSRLIGRRAVTAATLDQKTAELNLVVGR